MANVKAQTTALAGWFGADRTIADEIGAMLNGCSWCGVPFAGGMSALLHIKATTILVSDVHKHIINLARMVADKSRREWLIEKLRAIPVHPDILKECQEHCKHIQPEDQDNLRNYGAALSYFVCCWMGRGGNAGRENEFDNGFSFRWNSGGGDSAKRFRSATESLEAWDSIMPRCTFICQDAFEFLANCKDEEKCGLYIDPPWPDDGKVYKHSFTDQQQADLRIALGRFSKTKLVIRYGDHPLIRKLYDQQFWEWRLIDGRTQGNNTKHEVLITRR